MTYAHTQRGRFHSFVLVVGLLMVALAWLPAGTPVLASVLLTGMGGLCLLTALSLRTLEVRDEGARLRLSFGPLPILGRTVAYDAVRSVKKARSGWIDGWGVHWVPGRGWIWNIHGRDCVELELEGGRRLRIGTDDVDGLFAHLQERIGLRR